MQRRKKLAFTSFNNNAPSNNDTTSKTLHLILPREEYNISIKIKKIQKIVKIMKTLDLNKKTELFENKIKDSKYIFFLN